MRPTLQFPDSLFYRRDCTSNIVSDLTGEFSAEFRLGVARGLEQTPDLVRAFIERGHEVVSHGYRWIDYGEVPEDVERDHIQRAVTILTKLTGTRPMGWMTGRPGPNTRRLLVEAGEFMYDRDSLADELPYWLRINDKPHLVIPYSYETNDNRFNENHGFISLPTCGTLSIYFTGKAATAHRNCFLLVCMIDL